VKNIYDYFPGLKLVITGSSALDIYKGNADLSRRAIIYKMQGLSFREYIELKFNIHFPVIDLDTILNNANDFIPGILEKIKPIKLFAEYLQMGYYPFFAEDEQNFLSRLRQTVNQVLESDLPSIERIDYTAVYNLKKLLSIIAELVPYKPNILKLSKQVSVSRESLLKYLYLLSNADLLNILQKDTYGISKMNKPEKIFLNNPNLIFSLSDTQVNTGALRETFFYSQLHENHTILYADKGDFLVDNKYIVEVGGKNKSYDQIQGLDNAFIAAGNIEFAHQNKIPLWLFGFLY